MDRILEPRTPNPEARRRVPVSLALAAAWIAGAPGCGDDSGGPPDVADADADVSDTTDAIDTGDAPEVETDDDAGGDDVEEDAGDVVDGDEIADGDEVDDGGPPPPRPLVVLTSDYSTGGVAAIDLDTLAVAGDAVAVHSDAVLRCRTGGVFDVVERAGADRIRRFEIADWAITEIAALDLTAGSNPQDAFVLSTGEIAVPQYESTLLAFVEGDLSAVGTTTDLADFADSPDGLPEMYGAVEVGGRLFVSLQLLDRSTTWGPTGPGVLAAVDPSTHALIDLDGSTAGVQGVTLAGENPFGPMRLDEARSRILLSVVGVFGATDGGIEAVDPAAGTSSGFVISEADLGGDATDWIVREDGTGYALVVGTDFTDRVLPIDSVAGTVGATPIVASAAYSLSGLALLPGDRLAVGDRGSGARLGGVRIFDTATGSEITSSPIDVGLPPVAACIP